MARMPLYNDRSGLDEQRRTVFDAVVSSRGSMIRPYEVLLHSPGLAGPAAELGQQIRFNGSLSDHNRELAILSVSIEVNCPFEWTEHVDIARRVGVREEAIDHLQGSDDKLDADELLIVRFVRELTDRNTVSDRVFADTRAALGDEQIVELAALVGYYTMLAYVMNVAGAS